LEWDLIVFRHWRAGVRTDVKVLVPLHDERDSVLHRFARHLFAVDLEHTSTTAANATDVVEGERTKTEAVIFEVELKRVLARRQRIRSLPARALEINKVVQEYGLALQHIKPVTAKSAALRYDHAYSTGLRDVDLGFVVERRVENAWRITVRRAGDLARPSELGATGGQVGARCHNPSRDSGIERF